MDTFQRCVVYMVFSIGALIFDGNTRQRPTRTEVLYEHFERHHLPEIFSGRDLMKETTILLLLAMHALHGSSSNAIIQRTSAAIRTAITAGLHRRAPSQAGSSPEIFQAEQMRRRIWWCCYGLDRGVAMAFGHPVSIPDDFITVEVALDRMRSQFCQELEEWQASIPMPTDKPGYGGRNWFRMIAYYSVIGLASGLNDDIRHALGAKTVVACCNACITFQQIQRSRQIAHSWLALLSQFQAGVTILYCFWVTPPPMRSEEFEPSYASRGVRTCSNNLVLLAERWVEAEPYRDAFEILSKLVPLNNDLAAAHRRPPSTDLAELEKLMEQVKYLGAHYRSINMIEEILHQKRPPWADRGRHIAHQMPSSSPLQHYPPVPQPGHFATRYGEGFGLGAWYSGQGVDVQEYFGLGDPWMDSVNHAFP
ncbi:hypothetical protein GQ53DRAFT_804783 [Thozetella sp. PMI_491]|nr:hypothetical protein GQ53DRAFT_804783 [Thozetella sp. PMI_491]